MESKADVAWSEGGGGWAPLEGRKGKDKVLSGSSHLTRGPVRHLVLAF